MPEAEPALDAYRNDDLGVVDIVVSGTPIAEERNASSAWVPIGIPETVSLWASYDLSQRPLVRLPFNPPLPIPKVGNDA